MLQLLQVSKKVVDIVQYNVAFRSGFIYRLVNQRSAEWNDVMHSKSTEKHWVMYLHKQCNKQEELYNMDWQR